MNDINTFKEINEFQNDLFRSYQSDPTSVTIFNSFNNSNKWKEITSDPFPPNKLPFDPDKISNNDVFIYIIFIYYNSIYEIQNVILLWHMEQTMN